MNDPTQKTNPYSERFDALIQKIAIRHETPSDIPSIRGLTEKEFRNARHTDHNGSCRVFHRNTSKRCTLAHHGHGVS
jgi:hypothetical protein